MDGRQTRRCARLRAAGVVLTVATLALMSFAAPAGAADEVNLTVSLQTSSQQPVPDGPVNVWWTVDNTGNIPATNVVVDVTVPAGATVPEVSDDCAAVGEGVSCTYSSIDPGLQVAAGMWLAFDTTGTYSLTLTASADQADVDNDSDATLDLGVVEENADLEGDVRHVRVLAGTVSTYPVMHFFRNNGPTAAADAAITGAVTGATIVPGTLNFRSDYFHETGDAVEDRCTATATTFTCAPVSSASPGGEEPFVTYEVALPPGPVTVVGTATIAGRADPVSDNDAAISTLQLDEPEAEIQASLASPPAVAAAGEPFLADGIVTSSGELAAENVVATLRAPANWMIEPTGDPLPPDVECTIEASINALRCTRATVPYGDSFDIDALITPPAGTGSGVVTLDASTDTPEIGELSNEDRIVVRYAPNGVPPPRGLSVMPNTGLEDGDDVNISGTGFVPEATVYYCQVVIAGTPDPDDCGGPIVATPADVTGAFTARVTVARFLVLSGTGVVDCAQPASRCGIGAADYFANGGAAVITPITLNPQPPVDDPFGARITGMVTDPHGEPASGALVFGYRTTDGFTPSVQTTTDASGRYALEDAQPGIGYRLVFVPPTGSTLVKEWWNSEGSNGSPSRSNASDVVLTAGEPVATADAELAAGGSVTGNVIGPSGAPAPNVGVWLYRADDGFVGTYATTTAADGTYRLEGIEPDTALRLLFSPAAGSGHAAEWFDDAPGRREAHVVDLATGDVVVADAQLVAQP